MRIIETIPVTWKFLNDGFSYVTDIECSKYDDGVRIAQEIISKIAQSQHFDVYSRDSYIEILGPKEHLGKYKVQAIPQTTYTYKASRLSDEQD